VDIAAGTIRDVLMEKCMNHQTHFTVLNIVHPNPIYWSELLTILQESRTNEGKAELKEVPRLAWIEKVNQAVSSTGDSEQLPAMRLIGFFEDMALGGGVPRKFLSEKALALSPTLRDAGTLLADKTLPQWLPQ